MYFGVLERVRKARRHRVRNRQLKACVCSLCVLTTARIVFVCTH